MHLRILCCSFAGNSLKNNLLALFLSHLHESPDGFGNAHIIFRAVDNGVDLRELESAILVAVPVNPLMLDLTDENMMGAQFDDLHEIAKDVVLAFTYNRRIALNDIFFCQVEFPEFVSVPAGAFPSFIDNFKHISGWDVYDEFS